jgi:hypothetical protein
MRMLPTIVQEKRHREREMERRIESLASGRDL